MTKLSKRLKLLRSLKRKGVTNITTRRYNTDQLAQKPITNKFLLVAMRKIGPKAKQ